jgi:hypothetical protein
MIRQLLALLPRVKPANRILQTVERVSLTQHHTLHVVRIHGTEVVLATYPNGCTVIDATEQRFLKANA